MNSLTIKRLNLYTKSVAGKFFFTLDKLKAQIHQMDGREFIISVPIGGNDGER